MKQIDYLKNVKLNEILSIEVTDRYSQGYQTEMLYNKDHFEWVEDVSLEDDFESGVMIGSVSQRLVKFKALKVGSFEIVIEWKKPYDESAETMVKKFIINVE